MPAPTESLSPGDLLRLHELQTDLAHIRAALRCYTMELGFMRLNGYVASSEQVQEGQRLRAECLRLRRVLERLAA
jgi:hypothetical protein